MTNKAAVGTIQGFLMSRISLLNDRTQAELLDEAWKVVRKAALEAENRRSDEGTTTAWINIPEASDKTETERLADRTLNMVEELYEKIIKLQGDLCQVEKQTTKNEAEIERLKARMPKEWK